MAPRRRVKRASRKPNQPPIQRVSARRAVLAAWQFFPGRQCEWLTTLMLAGLALHVVMWPAAIAASSFRLILHTFGQGSLVMCFTVAAALRIAALIANGSWPTWGPWMRAGGALLGAIIWAEMALALYMLIEKVGTPPSPGLPVYSLLTIFEMISIYRALATNERHC